LETIERHDKNKIVKTISIDTLRSLKKGIDPQIHSVPALFIRGTNEYIFGKAVFDYLILPNRGILFTNQTTKTSNDNVLKPSEGISEPSAFTLGSIYSESFSSLENEDQVNDKNYTWDLIGSSSEKTEITTISNTDDEGKKKGLPSIEDLMKQRSSEI
jgi:hypothetical protein